MINSFILSEEEKKRIKKLHEATAASASGSYNQPMAFTEPVEVIDLETTFLDGDNIVDDSEEISLSIEDLKGMLDMTEEEEEAQLRKLHTKYSPIKENKDISLSGFTGFTKECLDCGKKALKGSATIPVFGTTTYDYTDQVDALMLKLMEVMKDQDVDMEDANEVMNVLKDVNPLHLSLITPKLLRCVTKCAINATFELATQVDDYITPSKK